MKNALNTVDTLACVAAQCEDVIHAELGTSSLGNGTRLRRKLLGVIMDHARQRTFEHLVEAEHIVDAALAADARRQDAASKAAKRQ